MGGCISIQISCDQVLNRAGSFLCGKGIHIRNLEEDLVTLEKAMGVLKARRDDVLRRVQREEAKGQQRLSEVQDLTWLVYAPNLVHLSLANLRQLEKVVNMEKANEMQVQDIIPFGKLETLVMVNLPAVKSIYWTSLPFPCLREMTIERCPSLAKLPLDSKSVAEVEKFVIKYKSRYWIEKVEWEDEATRRRFLPSRRLDDAF